MLYNLTNSNLSLDNVVDIISSRNIDESNLIDVVNEEDLLKGFKISSLHCSDFLKYTHKKIQDGASQLILELIIIIEAGHNDIILPKMKEINLLFKLAYNKLIKRASIPTTSPEEFESKYMQLITNIKAIYKSEIILTTLSCLNENLNANTNQKRENLNQIIKRVASYHNCVIADVGQAFNEILMNKNNRSKFLDGFLKHSFLML